MCGIWGVLTENPKIDINAFKILGMFNQSRGKDSVGVYLNGVLTKGVADKKEFDKFCMAETIEAQEGFQVALGHCRAATGVAGGAGAHNIDNCHPFVDGKTYQVHNGSIKNIEPLCKAHDVPYDWKKTDSEHLLNIIKKDGYKVLEEYIGYAACVWYNEEEPNVLYVYHGASFETAKRSPYLEERPLVTAVHEGSFYFSSMPEPLVLMNMEANVVPHNKVYAIRWSKGKIESKVAFTVNRKETNIGILSYGVTYASNYNQNFQGAAGGTNTGITNGTGGSSNSGNFQSQKKAQASQTSINTCDIATRSITRNMAVASDVFTPGMFERADAYRASYFANSRYMCKQGDVSALLHGIFYIDLKGFIYAEKGAKEDRVVAYFIRGVMIKSHKYYMEFYRDAVATNSLDSENTKAIQQFSFEVSDYSMYPVTPYGKLENSPGIKTYVWRKELCKWCQFSPFPFNSILTIASGVITESRRTDQKDTLIAVPSSAQLLTFLEPGEFMTYAEEAIMESLDEKYISDKNKAINQKYNYLGMLKNISVVSKASKFFDGLKFQRKACFDSVYKTLDLMIDAIKTKEFLALVDYTMDQYFDEYAILLTEKECEMLVMSAFKEATKAGTSARDQIQVEGFHSLESYLIQVESGFRSWPFYEESLRKAAEKDWDDKHTPEEEKEPKQTDLPVDKLPFVDIVKGGLKVKREAYVMRAWDIVYSTVLHTHQLLDLGKAEWADDHSIQTTFMGEVRKELSKPSNFGKENLELIDYLVDNYCISNAREKMTEDKDAILDKIGSMLEVQ